MTGDRKRLIKVALEEDAAIRRSAEVEHERAIAVFDLLEENVFHLVGAAAGPYCLTIGIRANCLTMLCSHNKLNSAKGYNF